jgi:hypothetical protein
MSKTVKALVAASIATASFGAFAGELYDPTAGQPTSTISQTGVTDRDAYFVVSTTSNEFVFVPNDAYVAEPAQVEIAGLSRRDVHELYDNS